MNCYKASLLICFSSYRHPFLKDYIAHGHTCVVQNLKNDLKIETLLSRKVLKFFCSAFFRASAELFLLSGMFKTSAYCMQHWLCSKENWTHTSIPLWLWVLWWCSSSRFVLSQYGPRTNFTHKHFLLLHCLKTNTSTSHEGLFLNSNIHQNRDSLFATFRYHFYQCWT